MALNIGIEASPLGNPAGGGLWSFLYHGIRELSRLDSANRYVLYTTPSTREGMIPVPVGDGSRWCMRPSSGLTAWKASLWMQFGFRRASAQDHLDVLWLTRHLPPLAVRKVPMVSTIFDVLYQRAPEGLSLLLRVSNEIFVRATARRSRRIIATSCATARDLVDLFGVDPARIDVAYGGVDHDLFYPRDHAEARHYVSQVYGVERPFILALEVFVPRKNFLTQLTAYSLLPRAIRRRYALVATGRRARHVRNVDVERAIRRLGLAEDVRVVDYVKHAEMPLMYSAASLLAFASRYEGFGLPIIEAMACRCPVLTSRNSSMPEAGGKAAFYASDDDPYEIAREMEHVLVERAVSEQARSLGLEHARQFTWSVYARTVLQALMTAANHD